MSDDEDWFERALREDDPGRGDGSPAEDPDDGVGVDGDRPTTDGEDGAGGTDGGHGSRADGDRSDGDERGVRGGEAARADDGAFDFDAATEPGAEDPFGQDFATAFSNAPSPSGGQQSGNGPVGDRPDRPNGPSDADGGEFGFGEFGSTGADSTSFDESEFDSDIPRISLGIEGLDEMILGGVPDRSLIAVIGSAGTGKTTFGLQFLNEALSEGDNAVYITLEESREAVLSTAEEKGWPFREHAEAGRLSVVAMDPVEMANSLASIRSDLPRLIEEFEADRLVLDSVSLLEMMYDHPSKRRSEVFDFARSLKDVGVTTMLTSEASEENQYASRHGIVEYLTDAVFVLQYVRPSDLRETRLAVEIQKIRDANHSRETKPYEITDEGISVHRQANIF